MYGLQFKDFGNVWDLLATENEIIQMIMTLINTCCLFVQYDKVNRDLGNQIISFLMLEFGT